MSEIFKAKKFPILYGNSKTGKVKEWSISVVYNESTKVADIITNHGYIDGQKQKDIVQINKGKNIGRANETTPFEQAVSQAQSKWNLKKDKGYVLDKNNIPDIKLPMLAKCYGSIFQGELTKDMAHNIKFPCYVQPKLNGVRCLTKRVNGDITFTSRHGKQYATLHHINKELKRIMDIGDMFDGEIYVHGVCFQDIVSAVKNVDSQDKATYDCSKLQYWIYDVADSENHFANRFTDLMAKFNEENMKDKFKHLRLVETLPCKDEKELLKYHDSYVADGYEGVIIRNKKGKYEFKHRSDNLQKLKAFKDEEFEIIDVKCGTGRYNDCATFICITPQGKEFSVTPEGDMDLKRKYLKNADDYIGKHLVVKYQEKSRDNIPIFPIGIGVRLEEDMPFEDD